MIVALIYAVIVRRQERIDFAAVSFAMGRPLWLGRCRCAGVDLAG